MNMIMQSTSWEPKRTFSQPTRPPHSMPAAMAARMHSGMWIYGGACTNTPTSMATALPMTYWPSAPMLNMPVLNENATESPVKINGVAYSMNA